MFPSTDLYSRQSAAGRQRGFTVVTAIFILVVLATLGAFMVTFWTTQSQASALDVQGSRAYSAARAGIEWAAYNAIKTPGSYGCTGGSTGGSSTDTLTFTGVLGGFTTTVVCTSLLEDDGGTPVRVYSLTSTARSGAAGTTDYVERQITATVAR